MNNYIGTVKNNYMFTNNRKQVEEMKKELSNGINPTIYNYDKLGKKVKIDEDIIHFRYIQPRYGHNYPDLILDKYFSNIDFIHLDRKKIRKIMEKEMSKSSQFQSRYVYTHRGYGEEYDNECLLEIAECEIPIFKKILHYGTEGTGKINAKYRVVEVYHLGIDFNRSDVFDMSNFKDHNYAIKCELIEEVNMELSSFVSWNKINQQRNYNRKHGLWLSTLETYYGSAIKSEFKLTRYNGLTRCIKIGEEK